MFGKRDDRTIDDSFHNLGNFNRFNDRYTTARRTMKAVGICAGVGFVSGAVGGVILGESINDYVAFLKEAPNAIQYAVDAASAIGCGAAGAAVLGGIAQVYGVIKLTRR